MSTFSIRTVFNIPMQLGECPLWSHEEGVLYWIDILGKAVHSLKESNQVHKCWLMPSEPGCIAKSKNNNLIVALRTGLFQLNTVTGKMTLLHNVPYDISTLRFNDGRCDAMGRLWIGTLYEPRNLQAGSIFCFTKGVLRDTINSVTTSNGIAFSIDQHRMYHSDTQKHCINIYDFNLATAQISNKRLFKKFSEDKSTITYGGRPDGATVDSENSYWCAMFEGSRILRISATGEILQEINLPIYCPTMIAFGGFDLRTLYITSSRFGRSVSELRQYPLSGYVLALHVDIPGQIEYLYKN